MNIKDSTDKLTWQGLWLKSRCFSSFIRSIMKLRCLRFSHFKKIGDKKRINWWKRNKFTFKWKSSLCKQQNIARFPAANLIPDHMFETERPGLIVKGSLREMGRGGSADHLRFKTPLLRHPGRGSFLRFAALFRFKSSWFEHIVFETSFTIVLARLHTVIAVYLAKNWR